MNLFFEKNKFLIFSIIIFVLSVFLRFYYVVQKNGLHLDELITVSVTSCKYDTNLFYTVNNFDVYTGEQIKDLYQEKHKSFNDTARDIKHLMKDDCGEYVHPDLYHIMYKLFTFPAKKMDLKTFIKYGFGLNLIIFCFSFVLMYKVLNELFKNKPILVPLGLAVTFLNTGALSSTILVRMYELEMFGVIALSYMFVFISKLIEDNNFRLTSKVVLGYVFASVICILAGYYTGIYYGCISLLLLVKLNSYYKGVEGPKFRALSPFLAVVLVSAFVALIIYPGYFYGVISHRADQVHNIFLQNQIYNSVYNSFFGIISNYKFFLLYFPVVLLLLALIPFYRKEKVDKKILDLICAGIICSVIVMFLSPEKMSRYVVPFFPAVGLVIPLLTGMLQGMKRTVVSVMFIVLYFFYGMFAKQVEWYTFFMKPDGYKFYEPGYDLFSSHIENVYNIKPEFTKHPETPVVFLCSGFWSYINLTYNFNDNQKYEFYLIPNQGCDEKFLVDNDIYPNLTKYQRYYLVIGYNIHEGHEFRGFKNKKFPCFDLSKSSLSKYVRGKEELEMVDVFLIDKRQLK